MSTATSIDHIDVDVLVQNIAISESSRRELWDMLSPEERARMAAYRRDADACRFLIGRANLRRMAGRRLGRPPRDVVITQGSHGKPRVGGELEVNVSHSGDVVVIAVARGAEIGVDVELINACHASAITLDTVFSPEEIHAHLRLATELRLASFFRIWTSKEAVVKAFGLGLSMSLQSFDVAVDPRQPPAVLAARDPDLARRPISMALLDVPAGHAAVLAALASSCTVRHVLE